MCGSRPEKSEVKRRESQGREFQESESLGSEPDQGADLTPRGPVRREPDWREPDWRGPDRRGPDWRGPDRRDPDRCHVVEHDLPRRHSHQHGLLNGQPLGLISEAVAARGADGSKAMRSDFCLAPYDSVCSRGITKPCALHLDCFSECECVSASRCHGWVMHSFGKRLVSVGTAVAVAVGGISFIALSSSASAGGPVTRAATVKSHPSAKVPIEVTLSPNGRRLIVEVDWHDGLDARPGRDRFVVRVLAGNNEVVNKEYTGSRPDQQTLTLRLSPAKASLLRKARNSGEAVIAVTQQSDHAKDNDKLYERNHVTVVRLPALNRTTVRADETPHPHLPRLSPSCLHPPLHPP